MKNYKSKFQEQNENSEEIFSMIRDLTQALYTTDFNEWERSYQSKLITQLGDLVKKCKYVTEELSTPTESNSSHDIEMRKDGQEIRETIY